MPIKLNVFKGHGYAMGQLIVRIVRMNPKPANLNHAKRVNLDVKIVDALLKNFVVIIMMIAVKLFIIFKESF